MRKYMAILEYKNGVKQIEELYGNSIKSLKEEMRNKGITVRKIKLVYSQKSKQLSRNKAYLLLADYNPFLNFYEYAVIQLRNYDDYIHSAIFYKDEELEYVSRTKAIKLTSRKRVENCLDYGELLRRLSTSYYSLPEEEKAILDYRYDCSFGYRYNE